jgi:hypothetical protein
VLANTSLVPKGRALLACVRSRPSGVLWLYRRRQHYFRSKRALFINWTLYLVRIYPALRSSHRGVLTPSVGRHR